MVPPVASKEPRARGRLKLVLGGLLAVLTILLAYHWLQSPGRFSVPADQPAQSTWEAYGGSRAGTRYAAIGQITPENVSHLKVAWIYRTGELKRRPRAMLQNSTNENTPILAAGNLVMCTPFSRIVALDPVTGKERWVFDPQVAQNIPLPNQYTCRGVAQWQDPEAAKDAACSQRIYVATADLRLLAIDARDGKRCTGFGQNGEVHITPEIPLQHPGEMKLVSPPAVVGDVIAVGSTMLDNERARAPAGLVQGFDARNGSERWRFRIIPAAGGPTPQDWLNNSQMNAGAANMWSVMSVDTKNDLLYVPTSSPSPDFYGALRPGDNRDADSIVALRGSDGKVVWRQQLVHHDIWDYDTPAQPSLLQLQRGGQTIPAVVQPTKQGFIFTFNRLTGQPIFPIVETPVPQTDAVPGEWLSPTQPEPVLPLPIAPQKLSADDAFGFTPWDRGKCRDLINKYHHGKLFTPPSIQGTILYPATSGGANWGGAAFDPERQILVVNSSRIAQVVTLIPRKSGDIGAGSVKLSAKEDISPMAGTPYRVKREWLLSPLGVPCTPPPWGALTAIDMRTGKTLWDQPLGSISSKLPFPWPFDWNLGTPNIGGPVVTKSGVLFIAATMDQYLRAIDIRSGKELWKDKLPAGSQTTPITYMAGGRQFVVITSGQHLWFQTPPGDYVIAYSLPKR